MPDEKRNYQPYESAPIPTYEEATSSRPILSQARLGAEETSDDAERQRLLQERVGTILSESRNSSSWGTSRGVYRPPQAETARTSIDTLDDFHGEDDETASELGDEQRLRRDMEQMEVLDPEGSDSSSQRTALLKSRFTSLRARLSAIQLPSISNPFSSIADRIPRIPDEYKLQWGTFARLVGLGIIMSLVYILVVMQVFPGSLRDGASYDEQSVKAFVQRNVDSTRIAKFLRHISAFDHVAGTQGDYFLANWVKERFEAAGMDAVETVEYQVYLNYPRADGRRVAIVDPPELAWEAKLEEEQVYGSDQTELQKQTLIWHGHSRAGNATGPLIYANYGSREDFEKLKDMDINVKGAIVLVKHYGTQGDRALKVKAAELAGAAGCLIYSDPAEDGYKRGDPWPDGRWRTADSVQRGAVTLVSWAVGDVLTPGWASTPDARRISKDDNPGLVNIPSLPLAWRDAERLIQALVGRGRRTPDDWQGGLREINEWWTGGQESPIIHLQNEQDEEEKQPIWDVVGQIKGLEDPHKVIYVGNHRDAWCFGAADPGSGTAVMLEIVHIFGELRRLGWRPRRSIVFGSWDAGEYNLIGSTEYVEDGLDNIRTHGIAYLNVDVGVVGDKFRASASPVLQKALQRVLNRTADPLRNATLKELWESDGTKLGGLGAGSDYVAFQDIAGCSSIDFGFEGEDYNFPYHSCYETYEWVDKFGDPGFTYHNLLAQVWALLILELADEEILAFDLSAYANAVDGYVVALNEYASGRIKDQQASRWDIKPLRDASQQFVINAAEFHRWEDEWFAAKTALRGFENKVLRIERMSYNARMSNFETHLLDLPMGSQDQHETGVSQLQY